MMRNKVFVDSGGWIACVDDKDKHYNSAISYFHELRNKSIPLYTSNYVINETITWVKYNLGHNKAIHAMKLWKKAEKSNLLKIYWIDKNIADDAWEIFKKYEDHKLSFADCTSFAICRKQHIEKVFGFDSDFNTLGFLLSPYQVHEERIEYNVLQPCNRHF